MKKILLCILIGYFQFDFVMGATNTTSCDFTKELQCGDVCIPPNKVCICGDETFHVYGHKQQCCLPSASGETCHLDEDGNAHCPDGSPMSLNQSCNGKCYNDYNDRDTTQLGSLALFKCNSEDQCVWVQEMCQGNALCEDKSDVAACNSSLTCVNNPGGFKKYSLKNTTVAPGHFYCQYKSQENDGSYDSLGREDETNLDVVDKQTKIDYSKLEDCTTDDNNYGTMCGEKCLWNSAWCRDDTVISCGYGKYKFSTNDKTLCGNRTFWENKSCGSHYSEDNKSYGLRCIGTQQHCYIPWYLADSQIPASSTRKNCEDSSDQIFEVGSSCSVSKYINKYQDLFCSQKSEEEAEADEVCDDPEDWVSDHPEYEDPHNCYNSCSDPGQGCSACSNPEYFQCKRNNISVCLHPQLKCDGHPQCDDAEDEDIGQCYEDYVKREIVKKYATYQCTSGMYSNLVTVATVCDGVYECQNGEDEPKSCKDKKFDKMLIYSILFAPILYFILKNIANWLLEKDIFRSKKKSHQKKNVHFVSQELEERKYDEGLFDFVNSYLLQQNFTSELELKRNISFQFYEFLWRRSDSQEEFYCTIHNKIVPAEAEMIFESNRPIYWEEKLASKVQNWMKRNKKIHFIKQNIQSMTSFAIHYSSKLKDIFLCGKIFILNGGLLSLWYFPTHFSSMIVICLGLTIIIPLILGNVLLVKKAYKHMYGRSTREPTIIQKVLMRIGVVITAIINPFLTQNAYENAKEETRKSSGDFRTETVQLLNIETQVKYSFLDFLKLDLALESIYQTVLQILLWFLARTKTPTTGGLNVLFKLKPGGMPIELILTISVLMNIIHCINLHLKRIDKEKGGFFPIMSKMIVLLWSSVAFARRVLTLFVFFVPSMGLFSILFHWKAEQLPFYYRSEYQNLTKPNDILELYQSEENVLWSEVDRWDYSDPLNHKAPDYTIYTGLNLEETFQAFCLLMAIHFFTLFIIKRLTVEAFRNDSFFRQTIHILEVMNMATPWKDWDYGKCSVEEFKRKHKNVNKEMLYNIVINAIFGLLMITPLMYTVLQISERHQLLERTIKPRSEEVESYNFARMFQGVVLLCVAAFGLLELIFFNIYHNKFHPWIKIVKTSEATGKKKKRNAQVY